MSSIDQNEANFLSIPTKSVDGSPSSESTQTPDNSTPLSHSTSTDGMKKFLAARETARRSLEYHKGLVAPPAEFLLTNPRIKDFEEYHDLHDESIHKPDKFWANEVSEFHWDTPYHTVCQGTVPDVEWFVGGETNLSYNCLDRHVKNGYGNKVAIRYETETKGFTDYTYQDLLDQVCQLAHAMVEDLNIKQGDRVLLYMPCCPENVVAMLACTRIGAIHSVVFGGYSASQIRIRADECSPKIVITADGTYRRGKPLGLKNLVDEAIDGLENIKILCLDRHTGANFTMKPDRDYDWATLCDKKDKLYKHVPLPSEYPTFILYTSGSTGRPKGVIHSLAGYMTGVMTTCKYLLDLQPTDVYWCTADMGWITGHSYVAFGPLLMGATQLIYEGTYNFPDWKVLFTFVQKHAVSILYTAPTLLKSLMAQNLDLNEFNLNSIRLLGTVGEPTNLTTWEWFFNEVGQRKCPIVDTWWQTETGSHMIAPIPGAVSIKPGSATLPFFGIDPVILNDDGKECLTNVPGRLFIRRPWPSMLRGMWNRPKEEFVEKYFPDGLKMYYTGDHASMDTFGYVTILGRGDDQMNVSGHRMGTAELETAILSVPGVAKTAVVPFPDEITGQSIGAFIVTKAHDPEVTRGLNAEWTKKVGAHVAKVYGPHGRPKYIYIVDGLPETKSGKTMRGLLRELVTIIYERSEDSNLPAELEKLKDKFSTMDSDLQSLDLVRHIASLMEK